MSTTLLTEGGSAILTASEIGQRLRQVVERRQSQSGAARRNPDAASIASSLLIESGYPQLAHLNCTVKDGVLELSGRVASYYMKQMAQTCVKNVPGIRAVVNHVRVERV